MSTLTFGTPPRKAALYAVEHWHYSGCLPAGKAIMVGVWEDGKFIGVVIFSRGANNNIASPYGLTQTQVCELTRVALTTHAAPVSQIMAHALAYLKRTNPGMRLVISYADPAQGHHGGIYQAGNWTYTGTSKPQGELEVNGVRWHKRTFSAKYGNASVEWARKHLDPKARWVSPEPKHRYIYPLDKPTRRKIRSLARDYPRAVQVST